MEGGLIRIWADPASLLLGHGVTLPLGRGRGPRMCRVGSCWGRTHRARFRACYDPGIPASASAVGDAPALARPVQSAALETVKQTTLASSPVAAARERVRAARSEGRRAAVRSSLLKNCQRDLWASLEAYSRPLIPVMSQRHTALRGRRCHRSSSVDRGRPLMFPSSARICSSEGSCLPPSPAPKGCK